MPLWFGITTAIGGPISGIVAPAFVTSGLRRNIGNIVPRHLVARHSGVVIRLLMAGDIWSFVSSVSFLVNADVDSFELVVSVALPWFVGLVGTVWWWHSISLAVGYSVIATQGMVPVGFQGVPDNVAVGVIIEDGPPGKSWNLDVVAHSRK